RTVIQLDYGAPALPGDEMPLCDTMAFRRMYVDAHGRVSLCCQLSEYGFNENDVIGDLRDEPLNALWPRYRDALDDLRARSGADRFAGAIAGFPCMRCAHALGKLHWLARAP